MANIRLQNPCFDETIKVKESCKYILNRIEDINFGHICCIQLHQIEPEERFITINLKNFAKVDFYEDEEDVNEA